MNLKLEKAAPSIEERRSSPMDDPMAKDLRSSRVNQYTRGGSRTACVLDMDEPLPVVERFTKASFRMIQCMALASLSGLMAVYTKASGSATKSKDLEIISGLTVKSMMVNSAKTSATDSELFTTPMEKGTQATGRRVRNTVPASICSQMVQV